MRRHPRAWIGSSGERHPPSGTAPRSAATAVEHEVAEVPAGGAAAVRGRDRLRRPRPRSRGRSTRAVQLGDTGYTPPDPGIAQAYADFAQRRFGWSVDPLARPHDVRRHDGRRRDPAPGHRRPATASIVTPPVYPPFYDCIPEAGGVVERVPLVRHRRRLGARPRSASRPPSPAARAPCCCAIRTTRPARRTRARASPRWPISPRGFGADGHQRRDPCTARRTPGTRSRPFLDASPVAARIGYAVTSASKAFNLAGLKCALMVTADEQTADVVRALPDEVEWRTGLFGAIAGVAAFSQESDDWLDSLLAALDQNRRLLARPPRRARARRRAIGCPTPGFLAWVDLTGTRVGRQSRREDPSRGRRRAAPRPAVRRRGTRARAHQLRMLAGCAAQRGCRAHRRARAVDLGDQRHLGAALRLGDGRARSLSSSSPRCSRSP